MATIASHHARSALHGLARNGQDTDALLIRAGINPESLQPQQGRINDHQMTRLVQEIWQSLNDEFMGFTQNACPLEAFNFCLEIMGRCATLREALLSGIRFYNLMQKDIATQLTEETDTTRIQVDFKAPKLDPHCFYLEFWMIRWHRIASWLCDRRIPLLEVSFQHHPVWHSLPAHRSELAIMFPADINPDGPYNGLRIPSSILNEPIRRNRQEIEDFIHNAPGPLLTIPGDDNSLRQHLLNRLLQKIPLEFPPHDAIAQETGLSSQAFHRRLKQEGTSYQRIKDDVRRELALTKLTRERLPVHEVAEIVGFSEPRSFSRAFKQWTGLSPREYCRFV